MDNLTCDTKLITISALKIFELIVDPERTKATLSGGFCIIWHLASFPQSSIIAATGLDFCVRNDYRYFPSAMGTNLKLLIAPEPNTTGCS